MRVSDSVPCPKCGKPDWCLIHPSGKKCICARVTSGMPKGDAGWLHYLPPNAVKPMPVSKQKKKTYLSVRQVKNYFEPCSWWDLTRPAQFLKLSPNSLYAIGAGYDVDKAALVFPMYNAQWKTVGCRLRRRDGKKWSLKGGREGVFLSVHFITDEPVFIAEGPTDAAALIEAGITNVLGRPSCAGGASIIQSLLSGNTSTPVIILSDPDEPGIAGAERLLMKLRNPCVVLTGPSDIRDFVTRFVDRSQAADIIMDSLASGSAGEWETVATNLAGQCFDFSNIGKVLA